MIYNWPKVVQEFRKIAVENIKFEGARAEALARRFNHTMFATDQFHPFDSDGELSKELNNIPRWPNYRSIDSYWDWKRGREWVRDALFNVFEEMECLIEEYYADCWNHPPGYVNPEKIVMPNWEDVATKSFARIIRAARQP